MHMQYEIEERFQIIGEHAPFLSYTILQGLVEGKSSEQSHKDIIFDYPLFIQERLDETEKQTLKLCDAINHLATCQKETEIENAIKILEKTILQLISIINKIRNTDFETHQEAQQLLVSVVKKVLLDTACMFQKLHIAIAHPEKFLKKGQQHIDLRIEIQVTNELTALESWIEKQTESSGFGWTELLLSFGGGWFLGKNS